VAAPAGETGAPIRIGYARCSTAGQELGSQLVTLRAAGCRPIFSEKISTRIKTRPELEKALKLAHDFREASPHQPVILTVHELKRLARNAAELMLLSVQLQSADIQLEMLTGPLPGVYDPNGMGSMLFAVLAVAAQLDGPRLYPGENAGGPAGGCGRGPTWRAAEGVRRGHAHLRPGAAGEGCVRAADRGKLTIKTGKNVGKHPSVASVYRALAEVDAAASEVPGPRNTTEDLEPAQSRTQISRR
jgi:hypothetical protein